MSGDCFPVYTNINSLGGIPKTNKMLCVNYTPIKNPNTYYNVNFHHKEHIFKSLRIQY